MEASIKKTTSNDLSVMKKKFRVYFGKNRKWEKF